MLVQVVRIADHKIHVTEKFKFVLRRVENIVGKEENAGYQHFSISYIVFKRLFPMGINPLLHRYSF